MSTPQSTIKICSGVRLDNRYEHSIYFSSASAQQSYFAGKVVKTFPAYSYLRKTWPLQVQATMEEAKSWSYLFFQNGTGKYYYYFITQVEYKNDNMVELTLELDVLQTYLFDFEMLDCFVERQHTTTDVIGEHTVDEGLELGELVTVASKDVAMGDLCILVMATLDLGQVASAGDLANIKWIASNYDGVFGGCGIFAIEASNWSALGQLLMVIDNEGWSDSVVSIWMYPKKLVKLASAYDWSTVVNRVSKIEPFTASVARPSSLNAHTPANKKLLTYPYCMLYASNNAGTGASYRFERFQDPTYCGFTITGALTPEGVARMFPQNYNGEPMAYEHGMNLGGFPTCAWNSDIYKLWLAQNQNQMNMTGVSSAITIAGGLITAIASAASGNAVGAMAGVGAMIGGGTQIGNLLAQKRDMEVQPPQAKGHASTSVNTVAGMQTFTLKTMTVTKEMAQILDKYLTMYGYRLNKVQKPNLSARPAFTYIKTVGCNISGAKFCTEDRVKITSIFDHGITFWKNGDKIADYSQSNTV